MSTRLTAGATPDRLEPALWRTISAARDVNDGPVFTKRVSNIDAAAQQMEQARQRGFSEGVSAARSQVDAEVAAVLQKLSAAIAGVIQLRHQVKDEAAEETVQLAIAIASRVLHRELTIDPDALLGLVKAALAKAQSKEIHSIRLHPSHEAPVRRAMTQLSPGVAIEIVADAAMKPGDVIFQTAQGQLDASLSTQLREIERGLADRVSG